MPFPSLFSSFSYTQIAVVVVPVLLVLFFLTILVKQYRRCPSNKVLVVFGKVGGERTALCIHGGGTFIVPLLQDYQFMSLEPLTIDIDLTSALSKKNIRVNVPSTFTIGISTQRDILNNAAERLLGMGEHEIKAQARDIILGQMRLVIATLGIEEINQDREKFLDLVNKNVNYELNKIGLEVINVNIRDITDESGYIEALGRKAAADAINQARIEVADAERSGEIGEATANREKKVAVANQLAQTAAGEKEAERDQRIKVAEFEAAGLTGEAEAKRAQDVAIAEQEAIAVQGKKEAVAKQRIRVAELEATATQGENESQASIADYNATLKERAAEAMRRAEVAEANAERDVLSAQREREQARLEKEQIVAQTIERQKIEIEAEAEAEKRRRIAKGEADAVLAKYTAEAEGVKKVLEAKAEGYQRLLESCQVQPELAPALLIIEKLPELIAEQVKAIQNLKIDKITVWDSGSQNGQPGSTAGFLRGMIDAVPPMHELAKQAGIDLPEYLGKLDPKNTKPSPPENNSDNDPLP